MVPSIPETPLVLSLSALNREMLAPAVGSKMANLGEIGNRIGLPVPQGFAITATAYKRFWRAPISPASWRPGCPRPPSTTWKAWNW